MPTIPDYTPDNTPDGSELLPAWKNGAQISIALSSILALVQSVDPTGEAATALVSALSAAESQTAAASSATFAQAALTAIQAAVAAGAIKTFASTANALSNGVNFSIANAGSGATSDGKYNLTISGGSGTGAAAYAVVSGGKIVDIKRTQPGQNYISAPSVTYTIAGFSPSTGAIAATIAANTVDGDYFAVTNAATGTLSLYSNTAGLAVLVFTWGGLTISTAIDGSMTIASIKDGAGSFLTGTHMDGRPIKSRSLKRPRLETVVDGNGYKQVAICDGKGRSLLTCGFYDNFAPEWVRGDTIYFTSNRRGFNETYGMSTDGSNQAPVNLVVYHHVQIGGQSWGDGINTAPTSATGLALTTVNATPSALMLTTNSGTGSYGPRPMLDDAAGTANVDRFTHASHITGLEPLREAVPTSTIAGTNVCGETPCSGFAAQYLLNADSSQRLIMDVWARGSAAWKQPSGSTAPNAELHPGSFHFANKCIHQTIARHYAELGGTWGPAGDYLVDDEIVLHGQADSTNMSGSGIPTPRATYKQYMSDWAAANNRHNRTRSRYHRTRRLYILQNSVMTAGLPGAFEIARAQQEAVVYDPRVVCFGPSYTATFNTFDNLHPNAADIRRFGELAGKWKRRIDRGAAIPMFFPTKAVMAGAVVTCSYVDPNGRSLLPWGLSIVLDAGVNVASVANSGVKYYDSGASGITVSSVTVSSDGKTLIVTLSGTPSLANSPYLTFGDASTGDNARAGKTLGARTNIRNGETELGVLSGLPLYDWHLHGQISVTAS